ncbi:MAG: cytochrome P450, partial [Actinobacteria bacterium]|nr:cytochrome P450 [Actinomycetota bacterium]
MSSDVAYEKIPHPSNRIPIIGDGMHIDGKHPTQSLMDLASELGPIYQFESPGHNDLVVTGGDLVEELLDESRFEKNLGAEMLVMREAVGDGVFSSWTQEPSWKPAHDILLPAFAPGAIKGYTAMMTDIANQLVLKWGRLNPGDPIDVGGDMVKLSFDTIALVALSFRPGSYYYEGQHPLVAALEDGVSEALARPSRLPGEDVLLALKGRKEYKAALSTCNKWADDAIQERLRSGKLGEFGDVLDLMLTTADKTTGKKLDLRNIRYQLITFLAAGYDTTSGMLTFTLYHLLKNPEMLAKAYAEVDEVLGDDLSVTPTMEQIPKLKYLLQAMKESLRLWPSGPGFGVRPLEDTVLGGKYQVKKGQAISILTPTVHRNPDIYPDPENFNPDHFEAAKEAERPAWAYLPFGSGQRACIGRHFSFFEAQLLLGMILQRFKLIDSFDYELEIKDFFSIKPENFRMTVEAREGREDAILATAAAGTTAPQEAESKVAAKPKPSVPAYAQGNELFVLFGSNLGTAEKIANEIAEDGTSRGFEVTLGALDEYVDKLPQDATVIITTSSYNGNPPDNGVKFHEWLQSGLAADALSGIKYTVFGCGDRVWASTFQKVPAEVDELLSAAGAQRVAERGVGDADDDFDGMYRAWYSELWNQVGDALGLARQIEVVNEANKYEVESTGIRLHAPFFSTLKAEPFKILENRELLTRVAQDGPIARSTRHIEFALPEGVSYRTGDHIALLPRNSAETIARAAAIAELDVDEVITVRPNTTSSSHLPLDTPFVVSELLAGRVELQEPVT